MTRLSKFLQVCSILAIAIGTFFVATAYVFLQDVPKDNWQGLRDNAFAMGFGMGSLALGALGLFTPWVNSMVFGRQRGSSSGENS
jgi:O-antigen/teichoic acid export membrane protein